MAQTVNVPGVGQLSFPDNMTQDDMAKAIQANYPQIHGSQAQDPTQQSLPSQQGDQGTSAAGVTGKVLSNGKVMQATPADQTDPTQSMSNFQKGAAGMGQSFMGAVTGAKQRLTQAFGSDTAYKQTQEDVAAQRERDKALEATNAGLAGNILGQLAMTVALPGGGLKAAAAVGAAVGGLTPTATGESAAQNAMLGAVLGTGGSMAGKLLGKIVGGVVQPFRTNQTAEEQAFAKVLGENNIPLNAAQQGGGKMSQTLVNAVKDSPYVGTDLDQHQQVAFTAATLERLGLPGQTEAGPVTMALAKARISAKFDDMAAKYPIPVDGELLNTMATIDHVARSELVDADMTVLDKQLTNVINRTDDTGTMNGQAFQNARNSLTRLQSEKGPLGKWAGEIHDALHDALARTATPEDAQAITQMRTQWKALRQVEGAITEGNQISPALLYGKLDTVKNVNQAVYGAGDQSLMQLAQAGKAILAKNTPNSGTTQRMMGYLALGSTMGAITAAVNGDPKEALTIGAFGIAGPQLAKMMVENPKSARLIGQWARSQAIAKWRDSFTQRAVSVGKSVSALLPAGGGSGQSEMPDLESMIPDSGGEQ